MHKSILRNGDVMSAAVLAALGVYIFLEARNWVYYGDDGPGPAFFPAWYGAAMVALSLALIVSSIVKREQSSSGFDWRGTGRALGTWLAFALSAALMGWLGFLLSFALLTFFIITVVFRESVVKAGAIAVGAAIGFYVVFPFALSVPLPIGVFGF